MLENGEREVFPFEEKYTVENVAEKLGVSIEEVEKRLRWFTNATDEHRHTKQYVLKSLYENGIRWSIKKNEGILLKEDFIEAYYKSRDEIGKKIYNYDFSLLPDIISKKSAIVKIIVNEPKASSPEVTHWEIEVSYRNFIYSHQDPKELYKSQQGTLDKRRERFIRLSKERYPGCFGYDEVVYVHSRTPVKLLCLKCGNYFEQTPFYHLNKPSNNGMCPSCSQKYQGEKCWKYDSKEDLIADIIRIYGDVFDFSKVEFDKKHGLLDENGVAKSITLIEKETERELQVKIITLLRTPIKLHGIKSRGEESIAKALQKLNIKYVSQKLYTQEDIPELLGIRNRIYVDFYIEDYNGNNYIIEYNGVQHYTKETKFYDFYDTEYETQVKRDEVLRRYCQLNNIRLIEIPYTVGVRYVAIKKIIDRIFINNEGIDSVIPTIIPDPIQ